jgi:hypothetical protein
MKAVGPTGETVSVLDKLITFFKSQGVARNAPPEWGGSSGRALQATPLQNGVDPPAGRCKQRPPPEWGGSSGRALQATPLQNGVDPPAGRCKQRPSPEWGGSSGRALQATPLQNGAGKPLASDHHPLTKSLLISAREAHPHSAIAKKSSSRKIWMTFATPSAPATASP